MPEQISHPNLDEALAKLSDQLLEGAPIDPASLSQDPQTRKLQETLLQLHQTPAPEPSMESKQRIQQHVQRAWEEQFAPKSKPNPLKVWLKELGGSRRGYRSLAHQRQARAARVAVAALAITILLAVIVPHAALPGGSTSAAATGQLGLWPLWIVLAGAVIYGLWWWRNKRK